MPQGKHCVCVVSTLRPNSNHYISYRYQRSRLERDLAQTTKRHKHLYKHASCCSSDRLGSAAATTTNSANDISSPLFRSTYLSAHRPTCPPEIAQSLMKQTFSPSTTVAQPNSPSSIRRARREAKWKLRLEYPFLLTPNGSRLIGWCSTCSRPMVGALTEVKKPQTEWS